MTRIEFIYHSLATIYAVITHHSDSVIIHHVLLMRNCNISVFPGERAHAHAERRTH